MRHSRALELRGSLTASPVFSGEISKINVDCFCYKWTRRDCPVAGCKRFVFSVPFIEYDCMDMDIVELFFASNLDVFNDSINEEFEMSDGESPAIDEVGGSEGVEV